MSVTVSNDPNCTIVQLMLENSHVSFNFRDGVPLSAHMHVEEGVLSIDAHYHQISVKGTTVYMSGHETDNSFEMPPELVLAFRDVGFTTDDGGPVAIEGSD